MTEPPARKASGWRYAQLYAASGQWFHHAYREEPEVSSCGWWRRCGSAALLRKLIKEFGADVTFLLGARKASDLLELDEFAKIGKVCITTEDGSAGEVGFVTNHSVLENEQFDMISTCGPKPMMVSVARFAKKAGVECEVSLENKMACGVGACLCCVEKTTEGHKCVCKDGPVINIKQLTWDI